MTGSVITLNDINFIISLAIPLLAVAVSWGVMRTRIVEVEKAAKCLSDKYDEQTKTNEDIKIKLAEIQKDILYIRKSLDKKE